MDIPSLPLNSKILSNKGKLSEESGKKLVSFYSPNHSDTNSISDINLPLSLFQNHAESSQGT